MEVLLFIKLVSVAAFLLAVALSALSWGVFKNERWGIKFACLAAIFFVPIASINNW
ncbi:MAG: hypothetical protein ACOYT7_02015 [Patescibacteria group bacterium]